MILSSLRLEAFSTLAKTGSFSAAAKRLGITQSALSQRILNFEEELGTALFLRDRAGLKLTEAAEKLLRYSQIKDGLEAQVLNSMQPRSVARGLSGSIRIAGFSSVMRSVIQPALSSLIEKNPDLQVEFATDETGKLLGTLKRGESDFIILNETISRDELSALPLGRELNILVEKKNYSGPEIYLDHDAEDQTTIDFLKLAGKKTTALRRRYYGDVYAILDAVKNGHGRAVLPKHLIDKESSLSFVMKKTQLSTPVTAYFYAQPYYTELHHAVIRELKANAGKLLA